MLAVGSRPGLFGRGTSGERCDAPDLALPGVQPELVRAVLATGTPVVLVLMAGRPYALDDEVTGAGGDVTGPRTSAGAGAAGIVYAFFAGQRGGQAIAEGPVDGTATVRITIANTGARRGAEVVQLYLHDPVAQTTRPVVRLIGFARVELEPGEQADVTFEVPADLASFTGLRGARVVEPGDVELRFGRSSGETAGVVRLRLTGAERAVGHDRRLSSHVRVEHSRAATKSSRRELMT